MKTNQLIYCRLSLLESLSTSSDGPARSSTRLREKHSYPALSPALQFGLLLRINVFDQHPSFAEGYE